MTEATVDAIAMATPPSRHAHGHWAHDAAKQAGASPPPPAPPGGVWGKIAYILLGIQTLLGLVAVGAVWWGVSSTFVHMQNDISNAQIEIAKIEAQQGKDRADFQTALASVVATAAANQQQTTAALMQISTTLARVDAQLGDIRSGHR